MMMSKRCQTHFTYMYGFLQKSDGPRFDQCHKGICE